ncbi:MAG TPA: DUF4760 domain-containing protein [Bryobacteraceae bacterium]|nr:DUF4760 domain-containing protein [Bryobacteraceae bacterium]
MIGFHHHVGHDDAKSIEFAVALLGGVAAIFALFLSLHASRVSAAAKFIERWNDKQFDVYRPAWIEIIQRGDVPDDTTEEQLRPVRVVLNFFEEVALTAERKEADEALLKDFFFSPVTQIFRATERWIDHRRTRNNQPSLYEHYEDLALRWRKKPPKSPPKSKKRAVRIAQHDHDNSSVSDAPATRQAAMSESGSISHESNPPAKKSADTGK